MLKMRPPPPLFQGVNSESRHCVVPPHDALVVDLDVDNANFANNIEPEGILSYRATREKYKKRLLASYGPTYSPDHNVPPILKFSYPGGKMRPSCNIDMGAWKPAFLGEVIRTPSWFNASAIVEALEKILIDKVSGRMGLVGRTPRLMSQPRHHDRARSHPS
jgi:hypothetical protein